MQVQILSDLHLELYDSYQDFPRRYITKSKADILLLAGNIGRPWEIIYHQFLADMAGLFPHVVIVAGNHEYYHSNEQGLDIDDVDRYLAELVDLWPNVYFLNDSKIVINGYKILGATLWSAIGPEDYTYALMNVDDYKYIYIDSGRPPRTIGVHHTIYWHADTVSWLNTELQEDIPTIIVTNCAPTIRTGIDSSDKTPRSVYASDLEHMMPAHLKLWAFGRTNVATDILAINRKTRLVANPFNGRKSKMHRAGRKRLVLD